MSMLIGIKHRLGHLCYKESVSLCLTYRCTRSTETGSKNKFCYFSCLNFFDPMLLGNHDSRHMYLYLNVLHK